MSTEEFSWDDRSAQPAQIGGKVSNFLRGMKYIFSMVEMGIRNLVHIPGVLSKYRFYRNNPVTRTVSDSSVGLAVSWDEQNSERIIDACRDLNPGSILVRVLSWQEDTYEPICEFIRGLGFGRDQVVIAVIQDRMCVKEPRIWRERFGRILELFSPAARYFQIGQAPNRKKWGIYSPHEYIRISKESADLKKDDVDFIGPSTIDFELNYMDMILSKIPKDRFRVVNSLLYVDRRGMPENRQWPSFDLPNKIRAVRAIADRGGFENAPLWITETNWPIEGTGYYCPAGKAVRVNEQEYADFLSRYFLLAYATGIPERIFWWELCARGYGLVDPSEGGFRKRDGYFAFKTVSSLIPGYANSNCMKKKGLYITEFKKSGSSMFGVWHTRKTSSVKLYDPPDSVTSYTGEKVQYTGSLEVSASPLFIHYDNEEMTIEKAFQI
ncbi:hypothetical protein ACFL6F_00480 [Planctomycetota bacterium]